MAMTSLKLASKWGVAGICLIAVAATVAVGVARFGWQPTYSRPGTESMASLTASEFQSIEDAFDLRVTGELISICILLLSDPDGATAFVRLDFPIQHKQQLLDSGLLAESRQEMHFPTQLLHPPEPYAVSWWQMSPPGQHITVYHLNMDGQGGAATAALHENAQLLSLYILRGDSHLNAYPSEFISFISSHPKQVKSLFPQRTQAFEGCWTVQGRNRGLTCSVENP